MQTAEPHELAAQLVVAGQALNRIAQRAVAAGMSVEFNATAAPGVEVLVEFPAADGAARSSMRTYA